jgi:hypothetical protein
MRPEYYAFYFLSTVCNGFITNLAFVLHINLRMSKMVSYAPNIKFVAVIEET